MLFSESEYYNKSDPAYTTLPDFDIDRMDGDYCKRHPVIDTHEMHVFINLALHHFYLRWYLEMEKKLSATPI